MASKHPTASNMMDHTHATPSSYAPFHTNKKEFSTIDDIAKPSTANPGNKCSRTSIDSIQ